MIFRLRTALILTCLALTQTAAPAHADEKEDLTVAFQRAVKLQKEAKYPEAAAEYEKALKLAPRVCGENNENTAIVLLYLGNLYQIQGKYGPAEPIYLRAIAIQEKVYGRNDPRVANTLISLGMVYLTLEEYAKAEPHNLRAVQIYEDAHGPDHVDLATAL